MRSWGLVFARLLLLVVLALSASFPGVPIARSFQPDGPPSPTGITNKLQLGDNIASLAANKPTGKGSKVDSSLRSLIAQHANQGPQVALATASQMGLMTRDESVLVVVEGIDGAADQLKDLLQASGGSVTSSAEDLVQAFLPLQAIDSIAAQPEVKRIRRPYVALPDYTTEGSSVINAPAWQTAGLNGSGIKIAILDGGFAGYSGLLGSELPPISRVHTQSFYPGGDITGGGANHGTACAEIIYDIAPAAEFYLVNFYSDVDFANAVDWLIANGVNIVSFSMAYLGTNNYDGTGTIDAKVNAARAAGIFWANSSGNYAQRHWEGPYWDPNGNKWHNFVSNDEGNGFWVTAGTPIVAFLTWNDSWSNPTSDFDLYLVTPSGVIVAGSEDVQGPGVPPSEAFGYTAPQDGAYYLVVHFYSGNPAHNLEIYAPYQDLTYKVPSSSLAAPADATGAVAVGAFNYASGSFESFSSQGPTNDGRVKPEISGPDGVSTYTYGAGQFLGTSASAPHVAAAAALVKQAFPTYSAAQLQSFLEGRAIDAGSPGKDNIYGIGKLFLGTDPTPKLSVGATILAFLADPDMTPGPQGLAIANGGLMPLTWTAQEWNGGASDYSWLSLSSSSGTAPSTINVSVNKSLVPVGSTVTGQIRIDGTSPLAHNTPQYVNVSFYNSDHSLPRVYLPIAAKAFTGAW